MPDLVPQPDHPDRCQKVHNDRQCYNLVAPGQQFCEPCGGRRGRNAVKEADRRVYLLKEARFRQRMAELKEHDEVKSLREEIALTRMLIEERLNMVKNEADLLASYSVINSLILTMERLVKTSHQMEQNLGVLLSKATVIRLGKQIVEILIDELQGIPEYERRIDNITNQLFLTIEGTVNEEKE